MIKGKILSIVLVLSLMISSLTVPYQYVKAEEVTVPLVYEEGPHTANASDDDKIEINMGNAGYGSMQALQNAGLTTLRVSYKLMEINANGTAGVQAFVNAEDCWKGKWENAGQDNNVHTIELDLTSFFATGAAVWNFGFQICNVTNATYEITEACLVQGEAGNGNGGSGVISGGTDIGTIDASLDYNFAKLLQYSLYFYDANMCGNNVEDKSLYSHKLYGGWRGNCHVNDEFTFDGKKYSAVGGYHDAGDHVKFGLPMAEAMSTLGIGYLEFKDAFTELHQDQHLKTILDYYCDYVRSCTVVDKDGLVQAFCYQVGHGQPDHNSWCMPEQENQNATDRKYTLIASATNPATDIVSGTAAALAIHYLNFGNESDLEYAEKLFAFATKNNKRNADGDDSGSFYAAGSWEDEYCLAAAMLYKATKKATYKDAYKNNNQNSGNLKKPYSWADVYQAAAFYAPEKNASEMSDMNSWFSGIVNSNRDKYYVADKWGSARYNCNVQLMMLIYSNHNNGVAQYEDWSKYQMSMILGNNSIKKNLVVGYNNQSPKQPHHRAASGQNDWSQFDNINAVSKYTLYGALVGGPESSDFATYKDAMNDAISNEVTLDYNAGLVGAAAALYLLNKDNMEAGFSNQAIIPTFYGGAEFIDKIHSEQQNSSEDKKSEEQTSSEDKKSEEQTGSGNENTGGEQTGSGNENAGGEQTGSGNENAGGEQTGSGNENAGGEQTGSGNDNLGQQNNQSYPENKNDGQNGIVDKNKGQSNESHEVIAKDLQITANVKGVKGVSVGTTYKLAPKKKMQLAIAFIPENSKNETITYSSSNKKVATIDEKGNIIAGKKPGTTIITIMTKSGITKTFKLKVMSKAITKIKIKGAKKSMKKGKNLKLHAVLSPKKTSNVVIWESNKPELATVSSKGKVKALKKGTVKITAIATDGSGKKKTVKIKIK